ncbi:MAG: GNAT family N-acetyltransferase [Blastocatellia bacterium]
MELVYPLSDLALARRLERAEAKSNAEFVEARAHFFPDSGATWIEVAGAYAMFDGVHSPCTQTFGLGMFDPVGPLELEQLETFFQLRGAPVHHEISPMAGLPLFTLLSERGYRPIEFTSVLYRPLHPALDLGRRPNKRLTVRLVKPDEQEMWSQTAAAGWSGETEFTDVMTELFRTSAARTGVLSFLAELDGEPIATGSMFLHDGIAVLAGASTIPSARQQGAQLAILESRLRYAAEQGCDLAMMGALPGSTSQRNAERQGFRIAYTRIKWELKI